MAHARVAALSFGVLLAVGSGGCLTVGSTDAGLDGGGGPGDDGDARARPDAAKSDDPTAGGEDLAGTEDLVVGAPEDLAGAPSPDLAGDMSKPPTGGAITCPGPGSPKPNGGACGKERWAIKVGSDPAAKSVSLVPKQTTIATLVGLPAAGGGSGRSAPTETTVWELRDVTMTMVKLETDSDYHIVLSDGTSTMVSEIPSPQCAMSGAWSCFVSRARAEVDAKLSVGSPQYPSLTVTLRGVGFFDAIHGQTGVAKNGIELHPILQICFGKGCTPS